MRDGKRWSLLVARAWQAGKQEVAADILATIAGQAVSGARDGTIKIESDEGVILEDLHKMLDETGFKALLKISEERCKELSKLPPSMDIGRK